nr:hypothetical protein [Tanacetum cinerariifolium]
MMFHQGEGSGTTTEPHHTPSPEAQQSSPTAPSSPTLPPITTDPIPTVIPSETLPLRQYTRRARIAQSLALSTAADEPISPLGDDSQGEACPTVSGLEAEQDMANIIKTSTLPHDAPPRVISLAADEGTQELEITSLKARVKILEDKDGGGAEPSGEDAIIKGRSWRQGRKQLAREDQRMNEQIAKDAEIARIHAEKELQILIDSLDKTNETIAKYLQEYEQFAADLDIGERIELINDLIEDFVPMGSKEEGERFKRKGLRLEQDNDKKVKTSEEVSKEDLKAMMQLVPIEEVELKKLYEPDVEDQLWTHTQALMHDPVEWRLYDTCGVHHVLSRDQEIFMMVEREYPLRKGLAIVMISNKLQVENYSQMANDLILKIHKIANSPRQRND